MLKIALYHKEYQRKKANEDNCHSKTSGKHNRKSAIKKRAVKLKLFLKNTKNLKIFTFI